MNVEDFRLLCDYNSWANHRSLESCAPLTTEEFTRDLGSSFPSVRDTLVHLMLVEWIWLERWHNRGPVKYPAKGVDFPDLASVRNHWIGIESNLLDFVASLTEEELQRVIPHKTMAGVPQAQPLWQMLQHLLNHGTYHRGQIATLLRQLHAKPVDTDLIIFYRERAARASS